MYAVKFEDAAVDNEYHESELNDLISEGAQQMLGAVLGPYRWG